MRCICCNCRTEYDESKSRSDWKGYCSAKCLHEKAAAHGFRYPKKTSRSYEEYLFLRPKGLIGSVPTAGRV
jgi:hypothetical protein